MTAVEALVLPRVEAAYTASPPVGAEQMARWQAELDAVVRPAEHLASLVLRWEPGDTWQPVQRFLLWELVPNQRETKPGVWADCVPPEVRRDLEGPSPRSTGHYDRALKRWVGGPGKSGMVDYQTWLLYHDLKRATGVGRWGMRWWVIQGDGGHAFQIPWMARRAKQLMKEPIFEMPAPGDLEFCEPGQQVWEKVAGFDKLRSWRNALDWALRNQSHLTVEEQHQAKEYAVQATNWWDEQCGDVTDQLTRALKKRGMEWKGSSKHERTGASLTDENTRASIENLFTR